MTHASAVAAIIAVAVCASTSLLIALGRRATPRRGDLGAVSDQWIAQHREPPSVDSR
jgi:hypothetical protein